MAPAGRQHAPMKRPSGLVLPDLAGPAPAARSRRAALCARIRALVQAGRLPPGARLPATRTVARELGTSRATAEEAYGQLVAEGWLTRRVGDGTYVAAELPSPPPAARAARGPTAPLAGLSRRGRRLAELPACQDAIGAAVPFRAGHPDPDLFPLALWRKLVARAQRRGGRGLLGYGDAGGLEPLRVALADHLATYRGVRCEPGQVLVLSSSQQALDLCARLLVDPGDAVWLEDPGYPGARAAFTFAGARIAPIPVDGRGLVVAAGERRAPRARLAYVTPSHQYPLGPALALDRRLALLAWARRARAWIVEDDYDAELRYGGRPTAAIQGLEPGAPVIYVGTFTKLLFPSLRLAWAVVPPGLVDAFQHARRLQDGFPPALSQAAAAAFLAEGHLGPWLRRLRAACAERRQALLDALGRHLPEARPVDAPAGLHLTVLLPGMDDVAISRAALSLRVDAPALSTLRLAPGGDGGLVLGFAALTPPRIEQAVRILAAAVAHDRRPSRRPGARAPRGLPAGWSS